MKKQGPSVRINNIVFFQMGMERKRLGAFIGPALKHCIRVEENRFIPIVPGQ
ncbi:MAG: hypothetical protein ACYDC6_01740 [Acidobacteriaceae bacterium]